MESVANTQSLEASEAPQTTIDCLPYEVLHRIIAFVLKRDRPNCALVNLIFHSIVCGLDKSDKIFRLKDEYFSDASIFESIIATRRRFNKVMLELTSFNNAEIPALLKVHGKSIKAMGLVISIDYLVEGAKILAVLKLLPNLEKLTIIFDDAYISDCQVKNQVTILRKLKHLKLSSCNENGSLGNFMKFLPENSIRQLKILMPAWNGFKSLMERQAKSVWGVGQKHPQIKWSTT